MAKPLTRAELIANAARITAKVRASHKRYTPTKLEQTTFRKAEDEYRAAMKRKGRHVVTWEEYNAASPSTQANAKRIVLPNGSELWSSWYETAERTPTGKLRSYEAWTRLQKKAFAEAKWLFEQTKKS